eukprot:m.90773 g.90773  ORF g.90773 m.90773 type:complete len:562 (-) comp11883_c0_seq2:164-1849(-)
MADKGLQLPVLGFGTGNSRAPGSEVAAATLRALEAGVIHLDCASLYRNEAELGTALKEGGHTTGAARERIWITSKLWVTNFLPEHVEPACRHTLASLHLDHLDLYLLHAPIALEHTGIPPSAWTPRDAKGNAMAADVPIESTWAALELLVKSGLCRHIGVSNFSLDELDAILDCGTVRPLCNQVELHPYHQQRQLVAGCLARGVRPVAFSPLGKGGEVLKDAVLGRIAAAHGVSVAQVCLVWNLQRGVTVIPHTLSPSELAENLAVTPGGHAHFVLTPEELDAIARLDRWGRTLVLDWGTTFAGPLLDHTTPPPSTALTQPPRPSPGVIRLWHIPTSRSSRVLWLLHELRAVERNKGSLPEVELQLGAGVLYREQKPDWYLEKSPNGKVPFLEPTTHPLPEWESGAMCLSLLDQHDPTGVLAPRDPAFRAALYKWAFYCGGTLDNLGAMSSPIQRVVVDYRAFASPGEQESVVAANRRAWRTVCAPTLCAELGNNNFMWGDRFTAIDVFVGIALLFLHCRRWLGDFPAIERYYHRVRARPGFRAAVEGYPPYRDPFNDDPL